MAKEEEENTVGFMVRGVDMLFDVVELVIKVPSFLVLTSYLEIDTLFLLGEKRLQACL